MGILIPRQLEIDQYIKLFSNPVSGIACEVDAYNRDHRVNYHCQNIRYSKSMMLGALKFWLDYTAKYYIKITRIYNPLISFKTQLEGTLYELRRLIVYIKKKLPDTFLFSHRYIKDTYKGEKTGYKYSKPMNIQSDLINKKYPLLNQYCDIYGFQENSMDIYYKFNIENLGIEFTVFPNEHPYIPRQKISKVGMTDRGNIYILHKKKVGAQKKYE